MQHFEVGRGKLRLNFYSSSRIRLFNLPNHRLRRRRSQFRKPRLHVGGERFTRVYIAEVHRRDRQVHLPGQGNVNRNQAFHPPLLELGAGLIGPNGIEAGESQQIASSVQAALQSGDNPRHRCPAKIARDYRNHPGLLRTQRPRPQVRTIVQLSHRAKNPVLGCLRDRLRRRGIVQNRRNRAGRESYSVGNCSQAYWLFVRQISPSLIYGSASAGFLMAGAV